MKIIYQQNPLKTQVFLNSLEKKALYYQIRAMELEDKLFEAHVFLTEENPPSILEAKKVVDPDFYMSDYNSDIKSKLDTRCDILLDSFYSSLQGEHCGDCVKVACSCVKCMAERMLGINTIPDLSFNSAAIIQYVFKKIETNQLEHVIEYFQDFHTDYPNGNQSIVIGNALTYLLNYKKLHHF